MKLRQGLVLAGLGMMGLLSGCQHYYMVESSSGEKTFFTNDIQPKDNDTITFINIETGKIVMLQNSSVREVDKGDIPENIIN